MTPAALASQVFRAGERAGGFRAGLEAQLAEDEEFLHFRLESAQALECRVIGEMQGDAGFEGVADELLLAGGLDGLGDDGAQFQQEIDIGFGIEVARAGWRE